MSGHNKWTQIKRQKGAADIKRGRNFTKYGRAITLAVKETGNPDPQSNFKLRLAIEKSKEINMPKVNISRAIDRGMGKGGDGAAIEEVLYEGFGPFGIALLIETATDNRKRASASIKHLLEIAGGSLGNPGSVAYLFDRKGLVVIKKNEMSDTVVLDRVLESGGEDLEIMGDMCEVYTEANQLHEVKEKLVSFGFTVTESEITYRPKAVIPLTDKAAADRVIELMESIEELDDVQKVHANFTI